MTKMTDKQIAAYEAHGFKRWRKGSMDRLYLNIQQLADKVDGNDILWFGEWAGSADSRRLRSSKIWLDVNTGELHVRTEYRQASWEQGKDVIDVARAYIDGIEGELASADEKPAAGTDAMREAITQRVREYAARQLDAAKAHYAGKLTPEQFEANEREYERMVRRVLDVVAAKDSAWVLAHAESPAESIVAEVSNN